MTSHQTFSCKRISPALLAALLASAAFIPSAQAQQAEPSLPEIQVSPAPKKPNQRLPRRSKRVDAKPRVHQTPTPVALSPAAANAASPNPEASRTAELGGIAGAPTTIITAQDIARSPGQTVQDVLATQPGIQLSTLYGSVNGAGTSVDLRGFGATATANTLILLNGRRLNDVDLAGVDFSTIPLQSIDRIEITRGNSGAVLYGDNAVGGVINIVTKTGAGGPPVSGRIEGGGGSYGQRFGSASATTNYGPWSTTTHFSATHSDGYRQNNSFDEQVGLSELRYNTPDLKAYFKISGDNQSIGLPGGRAVNPGLGINQVLTNRRGATTPYDYGDKQGVNVTAGFTKSLWNGVDFIFDGGLRNKEQQANYHSGRSSYSYVDTTLLTWSLTPRLSIRTPMLGMTSNILTGIDYYNANYDSSRSQAIGFSPQHVYNLDQQTLAAYWQQTLGLTPNTDLSYGGRLQNTRLSARDKYDPLAPSLFPPFGSQALPLDSNETNHALHIGLEHRFNNNFAVFARAAKAFRTPNVDERIGTGPDASGNANFNLKTQTSYDVEGGGKFHFGAFNAQVSYYDMHLKNELHLDPINFVNTNFDPTHRYGAEALATLQINSDLRLKGGFAYTRAVFEQGPFAGNDVPLVSRYSGSAGVSWNIWQNYLVFDATVRMWSKRRMDNDETNTAVFIPGDTTVDLKLSGQYDRYYWSASLNNAFNALYYDYAVASTFAPGAYSVYPLPGRTYMLKIGATF